MLYCEEKPAFTHGIQSNTILVMSISGEMRSEQIGEQMRQARMEAGLSLRMLAEKAGTSHATLLAYEKGQKSPTMTTYLRIIEAAGYSVNLHTQKRIREMDGISRSVELLEVLKLAEQCPAKIARHIEHPPFPKRPQ